jgi:hypothetical protein
MAHDRTATLTEELRRLQAEIDRFERKIASGSAGSIDRILLEATRRTHGSTLQALAMGPYEERRVSITPPSVAPPPPDVEPVDAHAVTMTQLFRS